MKYKVMGSYQYRVYKYVEADSKAQAIDIACQGSPLHEWDLEINQGAYREEVESAEEAYPDKITIIKKTFPFEEQRRESGAFFSTIQEAKDLGFTEDQIWSVVITDHDEGYTYTFGPSHHWIDLLGYVATNEKHDGNTYYEETM